MKTEATKLVKSYELTKAKVLQMKAKKVILKKDNAFLKEQIKNQMRHNKHCLKVTLKHVKEERDKLVDEAERGPQTAKAIEADPETKPFKDSKDYVYYGYDKPIGMDGVDFTLPVEDFIRNLLMQDAPQDQI